MSLLIKPTNITISTYKNNVDISFKRGTNAIKTEIYKMWDSQNPFQVTAYEKLSYQNLDWGKTYQFTLAGYTESGMREETEVFSFTIENEIIPTLPTGMSESIYKNGVDITFVRGTGKTTEIDFNDTGWIRSTVSGTKFDYRDLEWGKTYRYRLRSTSNSDKVAETGYRTFKIEDLIVPVAPTNVKISQFKNNVDIDFTKNSGVKTEIDAFWINGKETWDVTTVSGKRFSFANLPWGATYEFKLRSVGNDGSVSETQVYSFTIEKEIIPTVPTNIKPVIYKNNVDITFDRGIAKTTEIDFDGTGWVRSTVSGVKFDYKDLEWGKTYKYRLRSTSNGEKVAETGYMTFKIEDLIIPIAPSNVKTTVFKNNVDITFDSGVGIKTEIDAFWVDGEGTWDSQTISGTKFSYTNLPWGTTYYFKLRCVGNSGLIDETEVYSFEVVPNYTPTAPEVISQVINGNVLTLKVNPGANSRTRFKLWAEESSFGTFAPVEKYFLTGNAIVVDSLPWRLHYFYTLQDESPSGEIAVSQTFEFWTSAPH